MYYRFAHKNNPQPNSPTNSPVTFVDWDEHHTFVIENRELPKFNWEWCNINLGNCNETHNPMLVSRTMVETYQLILSIERGEPITPNELDHWKAISLDEMKKKIETFINQNPDKVHDMVKKLYKKEQNQQEEISQDCLENKSNSHIMRRPYRY